MRFSGKIGYALLTETAPGVWEEEITERPYKGDVEQRTEAFMLADSILPQYRTTTSVSVLSDGVKEQNYGLLRYLMYGGVRWTVTSIVREPPRMIIYIGDKYNGPVPA